MSLHTDQLGQNNDAEHSTRVPRKRKRRTFACTLCHRRKLKCDQAYPACHRCVNSGAKCIYTDNSYSIPDCSNQTSTATDETITASNSTGTRPIMDDSKVLRDFTSPARSDSFVSTGRARELRVSRSGSEPYEATVQSKRPKISQQCEVETFLFKGHEFATQYYGATHPTSALLHIPSLRSFITNGQVTAFATFPRLQKDFKILQDSIRNNSTKYAATAEASIIAMLSDQPVVRSYAELYFSRFEATYRILHGPTFWKDFDSRISWHSPEESDITFTVILLLVTLIANTIAPADWLMNVGSDFDSVEPPPRIIDTCKAWLASQTRKHLTIDLFQIRILIHVAELMNCIQLKQTWASAGSLLSFAKGAGLHRDPGFLQGPISPYHQQMRKILWNTTMELELLASLDRGMSSSVCDQSWDCEAPINLNDDEYGGVSQALPKTKDDTEFTSLSYLCHSQRSVRLRTELCSVLNNSASFLSHDQVLEYEDQIKALLDNLPAWNTDKSRAVRTMVEIQLRQYYLLIHFRFLQQSISRPRRRYSTFVCVTEAISILQGYSSLRKLGYNSHALLSMGGILRPSIALCYAVGTSSETPGGHASTQSVHKSLEAALTVLQGNVMRNGRGFKEYWHMSATYYYTMSQSAATKERKAELEREAWERVAGLLYRVTATRKNSVMMNGTLESSESVSPLTTRKHSRNSSIVTPAASVQKSSLENTPIDPTNIPHYEQWSYIPDISQWDYSDIWTLDFPNPM